MAVVESVPLNVVAIIQARMGSRRFPGKVLADLRGRPVLEWVVDAVKKVEGVHQIVVATTTNAEDKAIEEWCAKHEVSCFRGEPLDVLKRYADCAREYRASHVLRVTADCPLLDPATATSLLELGLASGAHYFALDEGFPDGLDCEGFTLAALCLAETNSKLLSEREHVTPFLRNNPDVITSSFFRIWSGLNGVRLTVDEVADLDFLEKLLLECERDRKSTLVTDALSVLSKNQKLTDINQHIPRNQGYLLSRLGDGL